MDTSEALKTLIKAGWITKEEAGKIEEKVAAAARNVKLDEARTAVTKALTNYLCILCPKMNREEHENFVRILLKDLEADLVSEDPIQAFLKSIGVA